MTEDQTPADDAVGTFLATHPSPELFDVEVDILSSSIVEQPVIKGDRPRAFRKQLLRVDLPGETGGLGVVRKSLPPEDIEARGGFEGAVVFIHGYAQNRYTWHTPHQSLPNYLAALGYDTYNVDLRGQGRSRRQFDAPMPNHPDEYIERDVPAVVTSALHLSGCDKVVLVGHSLGGAVSYAVSPRLDRAGVLAGVATVAAVFGFAAGGFIHQLCRLGANLERLDPERGFSVPLQWLGHEFFVRRLWWLDHSSMWALPCHGWYPGTVDDDILSFNVGQGLDQVTVGVTLALAEWGIEGYFHSQAGVDYVEAFREVSEVPVLVLTGAQDLMLTPADAEQAVRWALARDITYRLFSFEHGDHGWGHLDIILGRDAPRYVWAELATWLARVET